MKKLNKLFKELSLRYDVMITLVGIVLLISLVFVFINPDNGIAVFSMIMSGGLINILNGLKQMKEPKYKTTGMSYVVFGMVIIVLGFLINDIIKGA